MINDNHCTRGTEGQQISFEKAQSFPAHSPLRKGESTSRAGPIFKTPLATGFPVQSGYSLIPLPVDGSQIQISGAKLSCLSVILFCPIVHVFPNRLQRREDLDAFCLVFCYPLLLPSPSSLVLFFGQYGNTEPVDQGCWLGRSLPVESHRTDHPP